MPVSLKKGTGIFVCNAIIKFSDKKGICTMKLPFKHDIRVEPDKQLIISMGNYNGGSGPWVSLKVHTKEAMFIAQNLEKALEAGFYVPMDSCVFCGEKFTKTRGTVMLDEEKFAHLKCLRKEHKECECISCLP